MRCHISIYYNQFPTLVKYAENVLFLIHCNVVYFFLHQCNNIFSQKTKI